MLYFWAIIAVLLVWGVRGIVRWYNLPEVAKARTDRVKFRRRAYWKKYYEQHRDEHPSPDWANLDDIPTPSERRWRIFRRNKNEHE